jgi:uncharacterized membrane protein YfcA
VVLANLMGMLSSGLTIASMHVSIDWRLGGWLLASSVVGMPFGLLILVAVSPALLQVIIAVTVLVATTLIWRGLHIRAQNRQLDLAAGFVSGVLNTSTSMSGPPLVLYLHNRGLTPGQFRATLNAYFLAASLVATFMFMAGDRIGRYELGSFAAAAPLVALGWLVGHRIFERLHPAQFRNVVIVVLFLSAALALVGALLK